MTASLASGLGATFGFAVETAVGTYVAPDHFITFEKEAIKLKKNTVQSHALHGGVFDLADRRAYTTRAAAGSVDMDLYDRGQGLLWQAAIGQSIAPVSTTGPTFTHVFTPAPLTSNSLTLQVGRPQTNGTVQAFSYPGSKVTDWTLSVASGGVAALNFNFDCFDEVTSDTLQIASFPASNMLHFAEATVTQGGTLATASGVTTLTGGSNMGFIKDISIKATNALDTTRYFLGAGGLKAEQLDNNFRAITGTMTLEFASLTEAYYFFSGSGTAAAPGTETPTSIDLKFTGPGTSGTSVDVLIPRVYLDDAVPTVQGPGIVTASVAFTGLDDGANNPIQVTTVTVDETL